MLDYYLEVSDEVNSFQIGSHHDLFVTAKKPNWTIKVDSRETCCLFLSNAHYLMNRNPFNTLFFSWNLTWEHLHTWQEL